MAEYGDHGVRIEDLAGAADVRCLDTALPELQKSVNQHIANGLHAEYYM